MRTIITAVSFALATLPAVVSEAGTLGFALGNVNPDGSCKTTQNYMDELNTLKSHSKLVRTYTSSGCKTAQAILPAAVELDFQVVLNAWADVDTDYDNDKAAIESALADSNNAAAVYAITVGSEALYRETITAEKLLEKIQDMQKTFPSMKVGTVDSWNKFQDGTADPIIKGGVKFFMANAFSYWQGQAIANASHSYLDDLYQAFGHIQNVAGTTDIEIWNGETGWPSDGGANYGSAVASTANAKTFYQKGVCAALAWGFNVFYFEAFDEPGKAAAKGDNGELASEAHWGAFKADRSSKGIVGC